MSGKRNALRIAKARVRAKRVERHERWANRFPFNMFRDMWHGFTGEPR